MRRWLRRGTQRSFGITTVDEIRHPVVNSVVVAIMTESRAIIDLVPQLRVLLHPFLVVSLQVVLGATLLTRPVVAFEYGLFPSQILGATTALILVVGATFGDPLTGLATVDVRPLSMTCVSDEWFPTGLAHEFLRLWAAFVGAIVVFLHVRRRTQEFLAACLAGHSNFPGLRSSATSLRTETFLGVGRPTSILGLGDRLPTHLAVLESFAHTKGKR